MIPLRPGQCPCWVFVDMGRVARCDLDDGHNGDCEQAEPLTDRERKDTA